MKRLKKTVVFAIALITVLAMSACAGTPAATTAPATQAATAAATQAATQAAATEAAQQTPAVAQEVIKPSWFIVCGSYLYTGNEPIFTAIKNATNIQFQPVDVPLSDFSDKISTLLASNQLPDLVDCRSSTTVKKYGPQGAFVNLSTYMSKGQMPDFQKMLEKYPPAMQLSKAPDGNIYGGPRMYDVDFRMDETWVARVDILKKNNIAMPKTFDDLISVFKQLKQIYPDSIPFTSRWGISNAMDGVNRFMNTNMSMFVNAVTNKVEFGPSSQAYKDSLAFMAECYKEGLLDKDFLTQTDDQWTEKVATGKSFMTYDYPQAADEIVQSNGSQLPEGWDFETIDQPSYNGTMFGAYCLKGYYGFTKGIASTSKYIDRLVQFLNWTYSADGAETMMYGVKDDTYTKASDGTIKLAPDIKYAGNPKGARTNLGLYDQYLYSVEDTAARNTFEVAPGTFTEKSYATVGKNKLYSDPTYMPTIANDADSQKYSDIMTPIDTYVSDCTTKVVTGQMPLSDWDAVVIEKVKTMGINDALTLINQAYTDMMSK